MKLAVKRDFILVLCLGTGITYTIIDQQFIAIFYYE
jgi:hypothetical protein